MRVSEIRVKRIRVNQGLGVTCSWRFLTSKSIRKIIIQIGKNYWDLEICRKSQKKKIPTVIIVTVLTFTAHSVLRTDAT